MPDAVSTSQLKKSRQMTPAESGRAGAGTMVVAHGLMDASSGFAIPPAVLVAPLLVSGYSEYPPVINLVCLWDQQTGWRITDLDATSLRITHTQAVERSVEPSPGSALEDLARWTDLPNDEIGYLVGASRRSIYNWRKGSPVPKGTATRIVEAWRAVEPLAIFWPSIVVGRWLTGGEPSPRELAHEQRWSELQAVVTDELTPVVARRVTEADAQTLEEGTVEFSSDTRRGILSRFATRSQFAPRRTDWVPREETGLGEHETDEE